MAPQVTVWRRVSESHARRLSFWERVARFLFGGFAR